MAKELGVDISRLRGTGPQGAITGDDVLAASQAPALVAAGESNAPESPPALATISRLMAERTTQSWTQIPHFYLVRDIDARALASAREQMAPAIELEHGVKITHTDLLVALTARVLQKHPKLNATWTGDAVRANPHVNISLAIAVPDGVVGAVIPNAETASIADIALSRRELTERARSGRLKPSDLSGGTFTISNLGMYDIDAFSAIIASPQAGSLAVGRIADRVVAVNGHAAVRTMMTVTLSGDHRVIDGAQGALFLRDLASALQSPEAALHA
jgi:pyruvate dehydrogenase E2 component (dihydrolipoamide acetyltransferase)